jgi:hypothetical protein
MIQNPCNVWGSHGGDDNDCGLVGCHIKTVSKSLGMINPKFEATCCSEMLITI